MQSNISAKGTVRGTALSVLAMTLTALLALFASGARAEEAKAPAHEPDKKATAGHEGEKAKDSRGHAGGADHYDPFDHVMDNEGVDLVGGKSIQVHLFNIGNFRVVTKFMILEVLAAVLVAAIYIPLARRVRNGEPPRGAWSNAFESMLTFIREEVARPNLGDHDTDKHVPFLWTLFLFILFCNLLGMFPFLGSPTACIYVTGGLAVVAFVVIHGAAIAKMGVVHYVNSYWPHMDIPFGMGYLLKPMIFVIEIIGNFIKAGVLAVRLFANMFAGHTVLAVILLFIVMVGHDGLGTLWVSVTVGSVLGVVALSLLELFVAFLQAYIFVFLTALFMGMALHPQH
jgi:F-type H+-transporting ATPase subunit a